ncbi:hypothetical protein D3C86_1830810 [compost metagenome]
MGYGEVVQRHQFSVCKGKTRIVLAFFCRDHDGTHPRCFGGDHTVDRIFQRHTGQRINAEFCCTIHINLRMRLAVRQLFRRSQCVEAAAQIEHFQHFFQHVQR